MALACGAPSRAQAGTLVHFLNGRAAAAAAGRRSSGATHVGHATGHAAGHAARSTASRVQLGDDWVADALELLLLVFKLVLFGGLVGVEPRDGLANLVDDRLLVLVRDLVLDLLVLHRLLHR